MQTHELNPESIFAHLWESDSALNRRAGSGDRATL